MDEGLRQSTQKNPYKGYFMIAFLFAVVGAAVAVLFLLPISRDGAEYQAMFDLLNNEVEIDSFFFHGSFLWSWLSWIKSNSGSLAIGLLPLIFVGLLIKTYVFYGFSKNIFYSITIYISIFYLLHEGTQLRIAIALSYAIWACNEIWYKRYNKAVLLCGIGFFFHNTSFILPCLFFLCVRYSIISVAAWPLLLIGVVVNIFYQLSFDFVFELLPEHYMDYLYLASSTEQNSSNKFYKYAYSLLSVLMLLYFWRKTYPTKGEPVLDPCLTCSIYGCAMLFWLSGTIAVASRISDILTILIVPVLAAAISSFGQFVRYLSLLAMGFLFAIRAQYLF
jgi:hypothetical protein